MEKFANNAIYGHCQYCGRPNIVNKKGKFFDSSTGKRLIQPYEIRCSSWWCNFKNDFLFASSGF